MDFMNKILFTQNSGDMISRQSAHHPQPYLYANNPRISEQQPFWNKIITEVHSIREEVELINMLAWRRNTTMPVQRVRSFSFIQSSENTMVRSFPKKIIVEVENIIPSGHFKNLNFKQAVYMILQLIIGRHALMYKFGWQGSEAFRYFGLNYHGQCRIIFSLSFRSNLQAENRLKKIITTRQIIKQAFSLTQSISRTDTIFQLRQFQQLLLSKQNLTNSSTTLFIQQMCFKQGIIIPVNIIEAIKIPEGQQRSSVFHSFVSQTSNANLNSKSINFMQSKTTNELPASYRRPTTENRQLSRSFCLSERSQFQSRIQKRVINRSINEKRMNSSNCSYSKKKTNKLDLAFSMCILPANSEKSVNKQREIECQKLQTNEQKRARKYNKSNVTTCISSQASHLFDSERGYSKLERIHKEIVQRRKSNDSQNEGGSQKNINNIDENLFNRKNFENIVSIVLHDSQTGQNTEQIQINKLEKLMSLLSKEKDKIDELNQSYSVCDSPDKKKLHSRIAFSNEVEQQIKQISQYIIREESESSQINSNEKIFNGWNMNMNLLKQGTEQLKQSVYCGNESQIVQHSYLSGLKLSKLGCMGRAIERSQIPQQN